MLITSLATGGAQRHVRDLLAAPPPGVEYHLAGGGRGWLSQEAARLGVPVYSLNLSSAIRPAEDLSAYRHVRTLVQQIAPDLIHVHSTKAAAIGRLAGRAAGIPVVFTVHGWPFQSGLDSGGVALDLVIEWLLRRTARRIIVVSGRDAVVAWRLGVPRERVVVVENGIDGTLHRWHPEVYQRRLIYVGRLEHGKGLERLLGVLADLRDLPWHLTICGTGRLAGALEAALHRLALLDRVRLAGWVDDPRPYLAAADCLVLPSEKEGAPYSVLEALASGLFVIASAVGILTDIDLRHVIRVPRREAGALRSALESYLTEQWRDPDSLPRKTEVDALFGERFNLSRMIQQVGAVYEDAF